VVACPDGLPQPALSRPASWRLELRGLNREEASLRDSHVLERCRRCEGAHRTDVLSAHPGRARSNEPQLTRAHTNRYPFGVGPVRLKGPVPNAASAARPKVRSTAGIRHARSGSRTDPVGRAHSAWWLRARHVDAGHFIRTALSMFPTSGRAALPGASCVSQAAP
jgi:hypothetical protein